MHMAKKVVSKFMLKNDSCLQDRSDRCRERLFTAEVGCLV